MAASPEVVAAREHVQTCAECQRFLGDMQEFGESVRAAVAHERAPAEVRGRLFAAIARARAGAQPSGRGRLRVSWRATATAAVIVIAVVANLSLNRLRRDVDRDPLAAIAADHAMALGGAHISSADPDEVTRWLTGQVQFAMWVPRLPGARLVGARLCVMDSRRGAVVEYQVNGVAVSYFVVPQNARPADVAEPTRFDRATRAGYRVVSWREPGLLHAMVGNLPDRQLAALAKSCVDQARRVMAWLARPDHTREG